MPTNQMYPGLLAQHGLDLNPEELKKLDLLQKQQNILALTNNIGYNSPGDRSMANIGGMLGAALANRNYKPDADQQRRLDTVTQAQKQMSDWLASNGAASQTDRAAKYQEFLASAAFKNGLPDVGTAVLQELEDRTMQKEKQRKELEKIGLDLDYTKATQQAAISKTLIEAGKAGLVEVYPVGSRDPNASVTGYFDPETKSVRTSDGTVLELGEYKLDRPQHPPLSATSRGRAGKILDQYGVGFSEASGIRAMQLASMDQMSAMIEVDDLFTEALGNGRNINFTSDYGKLASLTNRWTSFAQDLAESLAPGDVGKFEVIGDKGEKFNMDEAGDRLRFAKTYMGDIIKLMPAGMKKDAKYRDRYVSMLIDLAYATARANEPGAKALTKEDYENAMRSLGASLNDPDTMRNIMFSKAMRSAHSVERRLDQFPEEVRRVLLDPAALENYDAVKEDFVSRFNPVTGSSYTNNRAAAGHTGEAPASGGIKVISVRPVGQ